MSMNKYKWMIESGIFFPIPADVQIYSSPGPGVFNIMKHPNPMDGRIGLTKIADTFTFDFKVYDLGCSDMLEKVKATWDNEYFKEKNQNLGIILNGIKGTGKTIAAKLLANQLGMPVLVVSSYEKGLLEFIQSLEFECTILIDEAEKTFSPAEEDASQTLLKIIDGVYNSARKLYILTTNTLNLNENLLGRPGRIRYIKNFGNLPLEFLQQYLDENLINKEKKGEVLDVIEDLEISTIDILKSIVDEVNIHGAVTTSSGLNVPTSQKFFDVLYFNHNGSDRDDEYLEELTRLVNEKGDQLYSWLHEKFKAETDPDYADNVDSGYYNSDWLENKFSACISVIQCKSSKPAIDASTQYGPIYRKEGPWWVVSSKYSQEDIYLIFLKNKRSNSVYAGAGSLKSLIL